MIAITIAICTYRRYTYLQEIIGELLHQSFGKNNYELIFIDSNPESEELEMFFTQEVLPEFRYSSYYKLAEAGLSRARNLALRKAKGSILAFLDDDAIPCRQWVEKLYEGFAEVHPKPAVVGGSAFPRYTKELGKTDYGIKEKLILHSTIDFGPKSRWFNITEGPIGANLAYDLSF